MLLHFSGFVLCIVRSSLMKLTPVGTKNPLGLSTLFRGLLSKVFSGPFGPFPFDLISLSAIFNSSDRKKNRKRTFQVFNSDLQEREKVQSSFKCQSLLLLQHIYYNQGTKIKRFLFQFLYVSEISFFKMVHLDPDSHTFKEIWQLLTKTTIKWMYGPP